MSSSQHVSQPGVLAESLFHSLRENRDTLGLEALQTLEHTIAASLSLVRSLLNERRPVHQLPAEILAIIFSYALPSSNGGFRDSGSKESDMREERHARVTISHVCRRWRAVALETASFWTLVDASHSTSWASACIERSGDMPMQVFLRYPLDSITETPLASHGSRIRGLFLEFPRDRRAVVPTELPDFIPAVPDLEYLSIATRCRAFEEGRPMVDLDRSPPLFPQPPPRLRMLILKNLCWYPAIPYEQLTHLHISQGTPVDLRALLALFRRCLALEKLVLADVYLANSRQMGDDDTVDLPHLRLLTLGINQSRLSMRHLLKALLLPPTVVVRISGSEAVRALGDLLPFPALPFTADFDTLYVDRSPDGLVIQAAGPSPSGLLLDFGNGYASMLVSVLQHLLPSLIPFKNVKRLTVRGDRWDLALQLLSSMPSLQSVRMVDTAAPAEGEQWMVKGIYGVQERAPQVGQLGIWSPRRELASVLRLASSLFHLEKLAFSHIAGEKCDGPPLDRESLWESIPIPDLDCVVVDPADVPVWDLPGIRPRHPYDW
ncbi:hypothetical protein BV20DRAFT_960703 [Pilatotrama ljubarskyi]|nr:hypothetical protein BV20DRAFT_960703 [Pilatotrama ljubarskyi]